MDTKKLLYILDFNRSKIVSVPSVTGKTPEEVLRAWIEEEEHWNNLPKGPYSIVSEEDVPIFDVSFPTVPLVKKRVR